MFPPMAPERPLRADAARNRQALIDAAQRLFTARGLSVTLDDIADEAGVNVATAYRHFANKQELAVAFLQQKIDEAISVAEAAAAIPDPWEGLVELFGRMLHLMTANRGLHDVFTPGSQEEWLQRLDDRIATTVRGMLERARDAGVLRREVQSADLAVIFQMLAAVGDIPASDPEALSRRYLDLILAGLRPADPVLSGSPPSAAQVRAAGALPPRRSPRGSQAGHRPARR